jgi:hypothetical protein
LPRLGIDHPDRGLAIESCAQGCRIDRKIGDRSGDLGRGIAGPAGQRRACPRHIRHQFAAAILHGGDRLLPGEGLRRPRIARGDSARRRSDHALEAGQDIVECSKSAFGIGQVDPGERGANLDRAGLDRGIGLGRLDIAIGARLLGMALGEIGNVLRHADPRHREIVTLRLERERSRDREALDAHAKRRVGQRACPAARGPRGIGAERLGLDRRRFLPARWSAASKVSGPANAIPGIAASSGRHRNNRMENS